MITILVDPFEQIKNRRAWEWLVKKRADFICERCGATEELRAHHKDHNDQNNCLDNGECLCHPCHNSHHRTGKASHWKGKKLSRSHREAISRGAKRFYEGDPVAARARLEKSHESRRRNKAVT